MDQDDLVELLWKKVGVAGSQKAVAAEIGVTQGFLGDVLHGRRLPGKKILKSLGLVRIVTYEPKAKNK
jgi:hypothetical protein